MTRTSQPTAVITGASKGLGRALAGALAEHGWQLIVDARQPGRLADDLPDATVLAGDVTDAAHRAAVARAVAAAGRLDLLVNNASDLGPSPLPPLATYPLEALRRVYETDVLAPLALTQALLPSLRAARGVVLNVSSDAAVEPYPFWGGYGSAKAAPDPLSAGLGVEGAARLGRPAGPRDVR